ncbi:hypothetical protein PLEOSDRAFT_1103925 [Pleurotus ostreatus PC15]|uniref:Uncharacterized protein n=1 Tax=Pleurotus ostreatus (strain PC15) TaxID=1137138 RepID=A0A067P0I5_PLEO1|nr:hypothetical protein PLEOSDRAFT_1103925 [Pleurotus ostreatus PC15]
MTAQPALPFEIIAEIITNADDTPIFISCLLISRNLTCYAEPKLSKTSPSPASNSNPSPTPSTEIPNAQNTPSTSSPSHCTSPLLNATPITPSPTSSVSTACGDSR